MAKEKACKECKTIFEKSNCPKCGSKEFIESFKGKVFILNSEESEISKNLGIKSNGVYAIRLK